MGGLGTPPPLGYRGSAPPPRPGGVPPGLPPPLVLLRCGNVEPHPGPMRVAQANVTSLRLHWHTVVRGRGVVLGDPSNGGCATSNAHLGRALKVASFLGGRPWSPGGGGGHLRCASRGGGILVRLGIPARQILPPKGAPRNEADTLAQTLWHPTRWCHVLVGLGQGADSLHAQVAHGVSAQPTLNRVFWDHATRYVARHGTAPQLVGGGLNFDLHYPLRAPPSILASLLTRWLVDADLELASALGRDPLC